MLTTPMVARFHNSAPSSSATETLKLLRKWSFRLRTTWRRSLTDCAASIWSSRVRKAIIQGLGSRDRGSEKLTLAPDLCNPALRDYFRCNARSGEGLNHVVDLNVAIVRD